MYYNVETKINETIIISIVDEIDKDLSVQPDSGKNLQIGRLSSYYYQVELKIKFGIK